MLELNRIYQGDCLEVMADIEDQSIDMILCDLPYGTTACSWDSVIPFEPLWAHYKRVIKPRGAIVLTGSQPFTSALVMSNVDWFKYEWIWDKVTAGGLLAQYRPVMVGENIAVFCKESPVYNPIKVAREKPIRQKIRQTSESAPIMYTDDKYRVYTDINPKNILKYENRNGGRKYHPTQKPVALFEYLIKTYTNEGETVLDNCIGSGTTAIAAIRTGRNFIGIEQEPEYVQIARQRIADELAQPTLPGIAPAKPKPEQMRLIDD